MAALFLAALVASRHNPALKAFQDKLVERGKPKLKPWGEARTQCPS